MSRTRSLTADPAYRWGAVTFTGAAGIILLALAFEHLGGYAPCPLCLIERYAYYFGVPVAFVALTVLAGGAPRVAAFLFALVGFGFLINAGLGGYHAGVEWGFWPGPDTCSGSELAPLAPVGGRTLLDSLATTRVVRCDQPDFRMLGLSFAGWNAVISAVLCITAVAAAVASRDGENSENL